MFVENIDGATLEMCSPSNDKSNRQFEPLVRSHEKWFCELFFSFDCGYACFRHSYDKH